MNAESTRAAADLAALLPMDHPLARVGRLHLDAAVRAERTMMDTATTRIGTPLRDAAVDPRLSDFLPPTNAGEPGPVGNPHGSHVVAIEVDDPRRIEAVRRARAAVVAS